MTGPEPGSSAPSGFWWVRLGMLGFPSAFRDEFGLEMEEDLRRQLSDLSARGLRGGMRRLWLALGLLRQGLGERSRRGRRDGMRQWSGSRRGPGNGTGRGTGMSTILHDISYAIRALRRRPGYATIAIFTIALGIGANTTIFSVINGVLLKPLPYPEPHELVSMGSVQPGTFGTLGTLANPEILAMKELSSLESVAGSRGGRLTLTGMGPAELIQTARVTEGLFGIFGLRPTLGRDLLPEEGADPSRAVVVVSHEFWTRRLGADPAVIGTSLTLDGVSMQVVGVGPAEGAWPENASLWVPGGTVEGNCWWGCSIFTGVGRLAQGSSVASLQEELRALGSNLEAAEPDTQTGRAFATETVHGREVRDVRRSLWILLGAVGLVLLIACANVAHLLLVRGASRSAEFAVRGALGASRGSLIRSVLMEGAVIAAVGGGIGIGLATISLYLLPRLSDGSIPRLSEVGMDLPVLSFTVALIALSTLVFGLIPGLRAARGADLSGTLQQGGRGRIGGTRGRGALLAAEVAVSLVLLIGAGLLLRTFSALTSVDVGYRSENIVRFDVSLPDAGYEEAAQVQAYVEAVEAGLESLPGVERAAVGMASPLTPTSIGGSFDFMDRPEPAPGEGPAASIRVVTPSFFEVYDIQPLMGRVAEVTDLRGEPTAYIVNESLVRRHFAQGQDPLGARIEMGVAFGYGREPGRIVGVIPDIRADGLTGEIDPEIYVPHAQMLPTFFTVSMLTTDDPPGQEAIQRVLSSVDPNVPLYRFGTVADAVRGELAPARFYLTLLGIFALLAVVLAAIGLYGVVAYAVSERTREIGVRVALGADRGEIAGMVVRQGLAPTLVGVVLGLGGAAIGTRVLSSLLHDVGQFDPVSFSVAPVVLLLVALTATLIPARRAARVDPVVALRSE